MPLPFIFVNDDGNSVTGGCLSRYGVWIRCKMTELPEIKNPLTFESGEGLWFPAGDALGFNLKMCAVAPC